MLNLCQSANANASELEARHAAILGACSSSDAESIRLFADCVVREGRVSFNARPILEAGRPKEETAVKVRECHKPPASAGPSLEADREVFNRARKRRPSRRDRRQRIGSPVPTHRGAVHGSDALFAKAGRETSNLANRRSGCRVAP